MTSIDIAKHYFDLSSKSDFDGIAKLFTDSTVYKSQNTGEYVGVKDILAMQRIFHEKFTSLHWKINTVEEIRLNVILFDYDFKGEMPDGEITESSGLEYVTIDQKKISQVEIRNKSAALR